MVRARLRQVVKCLNAAFNVFVLAHDPSNNIPLAEVNGGKGADVPPGLNSVKGAVQTVEALPAAPEEEGESGSERSVLQAKLTKLAIQIGKAGMYVLFYATQSMVI